jgi:hypothetical protein
MPTGYTAELMEKGQDFRTFALRCARAFGACIMQRDDPMQEEPKPQEPGDYYLQALEKARANLAMLKAMGPEARKHHGNGLKTAAIDSHLEWLAKENMQNARLDAMAEDVRAWVPPSEDHAPLKGFMLEQIKISRNDTGYISKALPRGGGTVPGGVLRRGSVESRARCRVPRRRSAQGSRAHQWSERMDQAAI